MEKSRRLRFSTLGSIIVFLLMASRVLPGDWPMWRGPHANGISEEELPLHWSATENVRWKAPLPAPGNSTPIISGKYVFLTQALDAGKRRALLAFDRKNGKKLWQQEVSCSVEETTHQHNPPCSGSPITDGSAVYVHFASAGIGAYDFSGKELWHRDLGAVRHKHGNGSSPVLYKDLLIIYQGPGEPTFLTALDKKTGATVWKKEETSINHPAFGSWSTPLVIRVKDHDELIMPLPGDRVGGVGELKGYDPRTGEELWRCSGLGTEIYATPLVFPPADLLVAVSGHNGPVLAVRTGGRGDVTATHALWRLDSGMPQRIGSGILDGGLIYLPAATGVMECLDSSTGKTAWKERLGGNLWGSVLLADGKLYVNNLEGKTFILAAGPQFQLLATNDLGEPLYAAPAASRGDLFLRTHQHLYCIAGRQ